MGSPSRSELSLFPLCFEFLEASAEYRVADIKFSLYRQQSCIDKFKIKLTCQRRGQQLLAEFYYDSSLFDCEYIKILSRQFQNLLWSAIAHPEAPISKLEILTELEKKQLIFENNKTQKDYPNHLLLHKIFEVQAETNPEEIAIVFENSCRCEKITYKQLNYKANQLAHYLQKQGVKPEIKVGICLENSTDAIVSILGVLKAGGAYVPLDPGIPIKSLVSRLQDIQASFLITNDRLVNQWIDIVNQEQLSVINLDTKWEIISQESNINPSSNVSNNHLAYILFTSGSTGKPKGVAIEHQQIVNYVHSIIDRLNLPSHSGYNFALVSTLAADLGNTVVFPALCTGGCLHIISYDRATDPVAFTQYCRKYPIDCLKIVPSHLSSLLLSPTPEYILPRQRLILGGEAANWELIEQIRQYAPNCQIFNHYGPTESTVGVLTYFLTEVNFNTKTVPLGKPLANTQVYILDDKLQLTPIGIKGEIYIGGAGLARCYVQHPELTAEKFIPHPFSDRPGARLYKTGDTGRYLPDGTIEFIGRSDDQVKIRGFRIEPAEIEAILTQYPQIKQAVVIARENENGDRRLAAYLVLKKTSETLNFGELNNFLRDNLPDYMLPSSFTILEALPLTLNGKVDRQALPAPEELSQQIKGAITAPRTPVEEVLAAIWMKILAVKQVGIEENFFELGGHSLLATQVISQIREVFQVELPLRSLFESPTVAELAQRVETALKKGQKVAAVPIEKTTRDDYLPLSFAQQRLWFFNQLEPNSPVYNLSRSVRLQGELKVAALEKSFNEIIRRHEVLRTVFQSQDGKPVQVILPEVTIKLPVVDLRNCSPEQQAAEIQHYAKTQAQYSFDLTTAPLLNVLLLQLKEQEYILLFTIHHIVADGWSTGVIIRELAAFYESFSTGKPCELPSLPIQYADFAVWQRTWLQKEVFASQMQYWKQQLDGNLPILELPITKPRSKYQTFVGKTQQFTLSSSLTAKLKALSQKQNVTLFMTLLAAFKTLLYRYTGQEDILVGSPIANRNRREIEELIGFFVNTIVLRTRLQADCSFINLLKQVREVTLGAYIHQDLPFELLVEELQPQRHLSHTPVFQVMFALQNAPQEELKLTGLSIKQENIDTETSGFDFSLDITEKNNCLLCLWEYNSNLFEPDDITRLQGHFQTLLEGIVANPEQRLSELPLLTANEEHQLLVEWNNTQVDYPLEQCIHRLFEAQVAKTPDAVAVVYNHQKLTYQELNQRANQLARLLVVLGAKTGEFIGICKPRDINFLIAIIAVFKVGGVYVPIDSTYPPDRINYMINNSEVKFLLTDSHWKDISLLKDCPHLKYLIFLDVKSSQHSLPAIAGLEIYEQLDFDKLPKENLDINNTPLAPAYMIYTSGSTGLPKGAIIRHIEAINHIYAQFDALKLDQSLTFLQSAPASSDISVWQFLAPILIGGKTVIVDTQTVCEPEKLFKIIQQENITIVELVPVVILGLLEYICSLSERERLLPSLKWMMVTGESVPVTVVNQWLQLYPSIKVVNAYGPTEAADDITGFIVDKPLPPHQRTVPIGKPLANLNIYILDSQMQLLPIGVPGEICVSGFGVGMGYWKNEASTKSNFIPNRFITNAKPLPGTNTDFIYKTGDLGRWLPDGNIEFLGRIDYQVKIRGFRIELGEIEAVINQYSSISTSVVVVWENETGNKSLVAYVTVQPGQTLSVPELRRFLESKLPSYMVPAAFTILEELPLTPNGKIDRLALPAPDLTQSIPKSDSGAFFTPIEEILVGIWSEVLGIRQIGIHDNFFELGGHSLLATQVISRVRKTFGLDIPLQRLFEFPTISELAREIEQTSSQDICAITPVSRDGNLPLSFAQARLWLLEQLNPGSSIYNMPAAVHFRGELNVEALEESINEIIRRHEVLRTAFISVDGQPLQKIIPQVQLKIPVVNLQDLPKAEQEEKIQYFSTEEFQTAFDFTQAPLLRCKLLYLGEQEYILLFTIHHIIFDGWSIDILIRELATLYTAFVTGEPPFLEALSIQYADFAIWQRQHLQGKRREALLSYWKQQLANLPVLQLPTIRPRTEVKTNRGASHAFLIPVSVLQQLRSLSQQAGVTLFMTLLASFKILLQRYTNQDDIVVGTDIANRNRAEIEPLIGFFINLLVLRTDLSGNPTFLELLQRVRTQTLAAYAHQDLPFDELVRELQPERHLSNTVPLFQVLFVLQNTPNSTLELPGLTLQLIEIESKTTRFDLALFLVETDRGIEGKWQYNADLFAADTITSLTNHWQTLINSILHQPQNRINKLEMLTEAEKQQQTMQQQERKTIKKQKLINITPQAINLSVEQLVKTTYFPGGQKIPLVIEPSSAEIDLISWAENNKTYIETELLKHGAILFRNFPVKSIRDFEKFAETICPNLFAEYGDLPRTDEGGKVYGSTPYPADKAILFHNESSHLHCFPLKIWFYCVQPAAQGGETPIVDCRKAYQLLSPQLREKLATKQLIYVRNFAEGLDVSWQHFFQTTDKNEVEDYCHKAEIEFEWYDNNGLLTRQIRPAVAIHPKTGEPVFFNQIQLHHISYLDTEVRESLLSIFGESKLPRNVYFGDGTPILEEEIAEINAVYEQSKTSFSWQKGDILMLDNMLAAHGRNPYSGQRKIVVAMGEMSDGTKVKK